MDVLYQFGSLDFVWDVHKAAANVAKHGVRFEQACEVVSIPWCGSWMPHHLRTDCNGHGKEKL